MSATDLVAEHLRLRLSGTIVLPEEADWDRARGAWNAAVDQQPVLVAYPEHADDVATLVAYAHEHGLAVAMQGTGHAAAPLCLEGAILVKTERMRGVLIDPDRRVARVQAGTLWMDVTPAAAAFGLAALAGSANDVGVVGYTLGGGLSWLSRRHGLAANSVVAAEVVTADGRLLRVDEETEPELFWALRGGGGSFAAVTALEFRLYPIAEVYAGMLLWPWERAREVLGAWHELTRVAPDELMSVGRLLQVPPLPEIPEFLRGGQFVVVEVAHLGDPAEGDRLLAGLRALGPALDTLATIPAPQLQELHMDPPGPIPGDADGFLVDALDREALDAVVAAAGPGSGSPLVSVELRHLGGALARPSAAHGALPALDGEFALFAVGVPMGPGALEAIRAQFGRLRDALDPWHGGRAFLNFAEQELDTGRAFGADAYARLQAAKRAYDPADLFRANHRIRVS